MASPAATPLRATRATTLTRAGLVVPLGLGLLAALSVLLRVTVIDAGLWIDEGLSVGIADRPLLDIPGVLRQDGSPPLYYMLLHVWINALGDTSEQSLHALSLVFAVATIPVAYVLARTLISVRAGWVAAVLFATNPFLTQYAQEARMYALVVLLSLVACGTFAAAFALRPGRRWTVAFALAQAALLYTHNWGLFLGAGLAAAFGVLYVLEGDGRARMLREGLIAAAIVLALYAPWLPTLIFQIGHTGAPWARPPSFATLADSPSLLLGTTGQFLLLIGAGAGLATLARRRPSSEARAALALAVAGALTLFVPWAVSAISPAFATRYLAVAVGPLVLLAAIGLARAGRIGLAVLALTAVLWATTAVPQTKSNVRDLASGVTPSLAAGDLVLATQPEQVPVLDYYLEGVEGLEYATLTGPLTELGVTDWRDGVERLRATSVATDLDPLLDAARPGQRIALVAPFTGIVERWKAPWNRVIRVRSLAWKERMMSDPRFRVLTVQPSIPERRPHEVSATIFVRKGSR